MLHKKIKNFIAGPLVTCCLRQTTEGKQVFGGTLLNRGT